jgi:hypothetical protein
MRQQVSDFESNLNAKDAFGSFQLIMADSEEVMEYYYRGKIQELEQSLAQLNILEHARDITSLCKEIVRTKNILQKICKKKRARCTIQNSIK